MVRGKAAGMGHLCTLQSVTLWLTAANDTGPGLMREQQQKRARLRQPPPGGPAGQECEACFCYLPRQGLLPRLFAS